MMVAHAELIEYAKKLLEYYQPYRKHGAGFMATCPICGKQDMNVTVVDVILVFCHHISCQEDKQRQLQARLKTDGWDFSLRAYDYQGKTEKDKSHVKQNIPAHDQTYFDYKAHAGLPGSDGKLHPITHCYCYRDKEGRIVWYQLRADTNIKQKNGKREKILKTYCSMKNLNTGLDTWEYMLPMKPKILYNLDKISQNTNKPIIVFEGEKAAEAGSVIFPDYICTTWPLGMNSWKQCDFTPLRGREVYLWPDNSEASIKQFLGVAGVLEPKPKIVFTVPLTDRPDDWDIADTLPEGAIEHNYLIENAITPDVKSMSLEQEGEIFDRYNKHMRVLWMGGSTIFYDKDKLNTDPNDTVPYVNVEKSSLHIHYPKKTYQEIGKRTVISYEIDTWLDHPDKIICYGMTYDPTQDEELIKAHNGALMMNKFMGFATKPKPCDYSLFEAFFEHIYFVMDQVSADYFVDFVAQLVQEPKNKPGVMPILIGLPATGKTIIGNIIQAMLGHTNVIVTDGKTFNKKWTGQFSGKLMVYVNEYRAEEDSDWLNTLLTDKTVAFEQKGKAIRSEDSFHRVIGCTNIDGFTLPLDDRRFFPIHVVNPKVNSYVPSDPKNREYGAKLIKLMLNEEALAGLHNYLKTYKIKGNVFAPPETDYRRLILKPRDPIQDFLLQVCLEGSLPSCFPYLLVNHIGEEKDGYSPEYPKFVLKKHIQDMLYKDFNYKGSRNAASRKLSLILEEGNHIRQKFYMKGSSLEQNDTGKTFIFPSLNDLRLLYTKHIDSTQSWRPFTIPDTKPTLSVIPGDKEKDKKDDEGSI